MYYCTFCEIIPYKHCSVKEQYTEWENFKPQVVPNKNEIVNLQFFLYDTEITNSHVVRMLQVCWFFSIYNVILVLQKYNSLKEFSLAFRNVKHSLLYIYWSIPKY